MAYSSPPTPMTLSPLTSSPQPPPRCPFPTTPSGVSGWVLGVIQAGGAYRAGFVHCGVAGRRHGGGQHGGWK